MDERRRRLRVAAQYVVYLEVDGKRLQAQTLDLSLRGALCITPEPVAVGTQCRFLLTLDDTIKLVADAEVVRAESDETALRFTSMTPETYAHLRKMIELIFGDADVVDDEELCPFL